MPGNSIWFILASAVMLALYDLAKKASVRENDVLRVLLASTAFGFAAYAAGLVASGHGFRAADFTFRVLAFGAVKSIVVGTSWVFTFLALRTLPVSIATPVRASAPAIILLIAIPAYGERPDFLQAAGMAGVFAGYFVFSWAGRHEGIDFLRDKAVRCAVAGAFFSAVSALWDKYVFQVSALPVEEVQLVFQAGLVFFYATALVSLRRFKAVSAGGFEWRWTIPFVGILLAGADWLYFKGLSIPEVSVSMASLLRRFSVVITFLLGARIFKETNLCRKSLALAVIVAGIVLICLGGH